MGCSHIAALIVYSSTGIQKVDYFISLFKKCPKILSFVISCPVHIGPYDGTLDNTVR